MKRSSQERALCYSWNQLNQGGFREVVQLHSEEVSEEFTAEINLSEVQLINRIKRNER